MRGQAAQHVGHPAPLPVQCQHEGGGNIVAGGVVDIVGEGLQRGGVPPLHARQALCQPADFDLDGFGGAAGGFPDALHQPGGPATGEAISHAPTPHLEGFQTVQAPVRDRVGPE